MSGTNESQDLGAKKEKKQIRYSRYSAYLYLAMALMIVGVATASIFALNRSVDTLPEYSKPTFSFGDTHSKEDQEIFIPLPEISDKPVFGENSGVTDDSSQSSRDDSSTPQLPPKPTCVCPIKDGEILKECALDRLVFSATMNDYRVHTGLDLAAPLGAEVRCFASGTVESVENDEFWGTTVTVRHEEGLVTVYANLDPQLADGVSVGKQLSAGAVLGYVGNTALAEKADEPHLHFEMLLNGVNIDPEKELPGE